MPVAQGAAAADAYQNGSAEDGLLWRSGAR